MVTTKDNQKLVPSLRFPEFKGDWETESLQNLCCKAISYGIVQTGEPIENGIPCVRVVDLTQTTLDAENMIKTTEAISRSYSKTILEENEIMFALRGVIGLVKKVIPDLIGSNLTRGIARIAAKESVIQPDFLLWVIHSKKVLQDIQKRVNGSALKEIPLSGLRKVSITHTISKTEQKKIASFLSAVDKKIEQLTRRKELLEQYKKGLMQKIFSRQIRFTDDNGKDYPDWEEKKLGKLCKIRTGKLDVNAMDENGKYRFYTCAKDYYMIGEYAFDTEALLVSGNGANVGYIHYYKGKFNAYQRTYVLDLFTEVIQFIKHYLEKYLAERINREKNEGNTPYIILSTLSDMAIGLPHKVEQQKIASFLTIIDKKIESTQSQLTQTQTFKKGLLQQMFV